MSSSSLEMEDIELKIQQLQTTLENDGVDRAKTKTLENHPDEKNNHHGEKHGHPKITDNLGQYNPAKIGPKHVELAVGKIDDMHDAEQ